MKYSAKKDRWAVYLIALVALAFIGFAIFFIAMPARDATSVGGGILMLLLGILLWTLLAITYEITSSHVVMRWGPLRFRLIRIDKIVEASPVNSISATLHVAFSSHAIRITGSRKFNGFLPPTVSISPQDRTGFLRELADASPGLELADDGCVRIRPEISG